MATTTIRFAQILWSFLKSFSKPIPAEAIVVCCSYDLRICDYACALFKTGLSDKLLFTGNTGNWTRHIFNEPEAIVFANRATSLGIDPSHILIEDSATNIGENVSFSLALLGSVHSVLFITKPNTILRVKLTVPVHCPKLNYSVACPDHEFPADVSNVVGMFGVISEMVGDIERIKQYPDLGYQLTHKLPANVLEAQEALLALGFDQHMPS